MEKIKNKKYAMRGFFEDAIRGVIECCHILSNIKSNRKHPRLRLINRYSNCLYSWYKLHYRSLTKWFDTKNDRDLKFHHTVTAFSVALLFFIFNSTQLTIKVLNADCSYFNLHVNVKV